MLQKLYIKNYAIIDELMILFDAQLNVITGETGAGKSIILGALSLILGDRADTSVLINRDEKCIVEASFLTKENHSFQQLLQEEELDEEEITIIRREINKAGKSRAFINDTPVTLSTLNRITGSLVDLHRQFDNFALKDRKFVYEIVDAMAENQVLISNYQKSFQAFKALEKTLASEIHQLQEWQKEADYKQFLFEELETAAFQETEIEDAEIQLKQLSHSEQIKSTLLQVYENLETDEPAINLILKRLIQQLNSISAVFPEAEEIAKRIESTWIELRDIAEETERLQTKIDLNEGHFSILQERVDLGYRLMKKHQVQTTAELLVILEQLRQDLNLHSQSGNRIESLKQQLKEKEERLLELALALHENRSKHAPLFSKEVNKLLSLIGMPNAEFKIGIQKKETFTEFGIDEISILWDANKSGNFQILQKSASGGELSRIMLCIKTLTAKALEMPTLIFDEVDTGISGEAARQVGLLMRKLSESHQVMSITHQPQIAAKGTAHYFVYKASENGIIHTRIRLLKKEERVEALAQMIGGDKPSSAALKNAKELIEE